MRLGRRTDRVPINVHSESMLIEMLVKNVVVYTKIIMFTAFKNIRKHIQWP